jgi:hypothetical protein
VTAVQAARAAARIRKDLGIEPKMVHGRYGEMKVLVDGRVVIEAGLVSILGILPSVDAIVGAVRQGVGEQARP